MKTITAIVLCALAITACGPDSKTSKSTAATYYANAIDWQRRMITECRANDAINTRYNIPAGTDFRTAIETAIYADSTVPLPDGLAPMKGYHFPTSCDVSAAGIYNDCKGIAAWLYHQVQKARIVPDNCLRIRIYYCGPDLAGAHAEVVAQSPDGKWFMVQWGVPSEDVFISRNAHGQFLSNLTPVYDFNLFDAAPVVDWN